jgi:hypothetical protein
MTGANDDPWQRPRFEAGGGDAFLMYFVYGTFLNPVRCSQSAYRTRGLPAGVTSSRRSRVEDADWFAAWEAGWFGEGLQRAGLFSDVRHAPHALVVQGTVADPGDLLYLRDTLGVVTSLVDATGVAVLDTQILRWWSPAEWRETLFTPDEPRPRQHVVILWSEEEANPGRRWYHTRGMRKFGRPDLSMHAVPVDLGSAVVDLFERSIEMLALGAVIPDGQPIRIRSLPSGLVCRNGGDLDDHDFNNVHVEVTWPGGEP